MVVCWIALGFTLRNLQEGPGRRQGNLDLGSLCTTTYMAPGNLKITVKQDIIEVVRKDLERFFEMNVIPLKELRTFIVRLKSRGRRPVQDERAVHRI